MAAHMRQQPPAAVLDLRSVVQHWPDPGLLGLSRELLLTPATPITPRHLAGLAGPTKGLLQPASRAQPKTVGRGGAQSINVQRDRDLLDLDDATTTNSVSYNIS